jgi:hypothetical protein
MHVPSCRMDGDRREVGEAPGYPGALETDTSWIGQLIRRWMPGLANDRCQQPAVGPRLSPPYWVQFGEPLDPCFDEGPHPTGSPCLPLERVPCHHRRRHVSVWDSARPWLSPRPVRRLPVRAPRAAVVTGRTVCASCGGRRMAEQAARSSASHVATSAARSVSRCARDAPRPGQGAHLPDDNSTTPPGPTTRRISVRPSTVRETSHVPSETK